MIAFALGAALAHLGQSGVLPPRVSPGQAPPPEVPLRQPLPGPQAPQNPTGALPARPTAPPPRIDDTKVPPAVVAPADTTSGEVPLGALTAQEAARIALRLQPSILGARGAAQTQRGIAQETAADLNPQVNLSAGYANGNVTGGAGSPTGTLAPGSSLAYPVSASAGVSQLLFDFNRTRNLVRQDRALADAALADLDRTALNAVNDVETAFYNVANDHRLVLVAEANIINRQRQLELAQARFNGGIGLPSDVVTAETSKSQAVLALVTARDQEQQDRVILLQRMGLNPLTPLEPSQTDEPSVAIADPRALIVTGLNRRPEVRSAAKSVLAYKYGVDAAKALDLPSIYGTFGTGFSFANLGFGTPGDSVALGIGLTFPIVDGGRRRGAITAANGQLATAQADLKTAVLQVQSDVTSAYLSLRSAEQRVVAAASEVKNAEEGVRIAEGRYANGLGLFQDITTAQELLNQALQDEVIARNALNQARVKVRYSTGQFP